MTVRFIVGDTRDVLATLPDNSVDLVMTSPPFLALRSYLPADHPDKNKEIGSEPDPATFLSTMLALVGEWERVLTPHGSICVELGDTYSGSGGAGGDYGDGGLREGQQKFRQGSSRWRGYDGRGPRDTTRVDEANVGALPVSGGTGWPLAKSLCFIPQLFGASLAYGRNLLTGEPTATGQWRVRNFVAWVRPNPPVGALGDKVRPATSYLTWATKSDKRWFDLDAVRDKTKEPNTTPRAGKKEIANPDRGTNTQGTGDNPAGAPPLDWWCIPPGGYSGSHYAVFPAELCRIPIEASCPRRVCRTCGVPSRRVVESARVVEKDDTTRIKTAVRNSGFSSQVPEEGWEYERTTSGWTTCNCPGTDGIRLDGFHDGSGWRPGIVLDPFAGSGTTLLAASGRSRDAIGIDLDERNADLARERLGMFLTVDELAARPVEVVNL